MYYLFNFYLILSSFITIAIIAIYWYFTKNYNYWSKRGIKGPKPVIGFGTSIYEFFSENSDLEVEWLQKYGKIYGLFKASRPLLVVADLKLIQDICIKDFDLFNNKGVKRLNPITNKTIFRADDKDWKRMRAIAGPVFSSSNVRKMYPKISKCMADMTKAMTMYAKERQEVDIQLLISKLMYHINGTCSFDYKIDSHNDNEFVEKSRKVFEFNFIFEAAKAILPASFNRHLTRFGSEGEVGNKWLINFGRQLIAQKRDATNSNDKNFVDMLLKLLKSDDYISAEQNCDQNSNYSKDGKRIFKVGKYISEEEFLGNTWVWAVANYLMTGSVLSFVIYELALNQDCQQRLYEELCASFDAVEDMDVEILSQLPYLDAVISETMRMHAPTMKAKRTPDRDYKLGDTGLVVEKGVNIEIPIYGIHYCEEYFPNARKFIPDRFMPENKHQIRPYTYMPFGIGPRNCMGNRFAVQQMKICLAEMCRKFTFYTTKRTEIPTKLFKNLNFHCPDSIVVGINERP